MIHWQSTDPSPPLAPGEIHVWRLPGRVAATAIDWLDAAERARLEAIADPAARAGRLATRAGLRRVLAGYLDCPPQALALSAAAGGKPHVADGPAFNLSHCGGLALLAVADREVGIDVERLRAVPRALAIARRVLDAQVATGLAALPDDQLATGFLAAWTAMEARQKCLGRGVFATGVAPDAVGSLGFDPDAAHLGHLAWVEPARMPRIRWFTPSS